MELNFDLLVSGCNTRCRHCYVKGGPGKNMPAEDALLCIEKLDAVAARLPFAASFTLDNEPMNHPELPAILRAAASTRQIRHYHHGMTTGLALLAREDRDAVVETYLDCGWEDFGVTLHGGPAHHDGIVRRPGAFRGALAAAEYLKSRGAKLNVSLMLNRFFPEDAEELDRVLAALAPEFIWFAIPNYTPHANMGDFEPYRAALPELRALEPWLPRWGQDVALVQKAWTHTPGAAAARLAEGLSLRALFGQEQEELYCTVHPDCRLYLGNTGAETRCLGDLRALDPDRTAAELALASGNRDYGAFYDPERLPTEAALAVALRRLPPELLYADLPSVLYRGLAELGIPTRLL
jgi:hypothetical protein